MSSIYIDYSMSSLIDSNETLQNRLPISEEEQILGNVSDDPNQQLWSIRLPRNIPSLRSITCIPLDGTPFSIGTTQFRLMSVETSVDMRMLVGDNDEDESEDSDGQQHYLKLAKPFKRHFALVEIENQMEEEQECGIKNDEVDIKRAYTTVPQAINMKRRWTVPGQFAFTKDNVQIINPLQATVSGNITTPNKKKKVKEENSGSDKKAKKEKKSAKKEKKKKN